MRAELANLNHRAVPFLSRATANLCRYYSGKLSFYIISIRCQRNLGRFILLTKITAAQYEVALSYHKLRGLYFLIVVFAGNINIDNSKATNTYSMPIAVKNLVCNLLMAV